VVVANSEIDFQQMVFNQNREQIHSLISGTMSDYIEENFEMQEIDEGLQPDTYQCKSLHIHQNDLKIICTEASSLFNEEN
jgi:hypothetical protein